MPKFRVNEDWVIAKTFTPTEIAERKKLLKTHRLLFAAFFATIIAIFPLALVIVKLHFPLQVGGLALWLALLFLVFHKQAPIEKQLNAYHERIFGKPTTREKRLGRIFIAEFVALIISPVMLLPLKVQPQIAPIMGGFCAIIVATLLYSAHLVRKRESTALRKWAKEIMHEGGRQA